MVRSLYLTITLLTFVLVCRSEKCNVTEYDPPEIKYNDDHDSLISGWVNLADGFIDQIKLSDLPYDWINSTVYSIRHSNTTDVNALIQEILKFEAGFATCLILGLIYVIVMGCAWTCFLCCRCCGHCGANKVQRQTENIKSRKLVYVVGTVAVLGFLATAVSLAFLANWQMKDVVLNGDKTVNQVLDGIEDFVNETQMQISIVTDDCIGGRIEKIKSYVSSEFIKEHYGEEIKEKSKELLSPIEIHLILARKDVEPLLKLYDDVQFVKNNEEKVAGLWNKIDEIQNWCLANSGSSGCDSVKNLNRVEFEEEQNNSFKRIHYSTISNLKKLKEINFVEKLQTVINKIPNTVDEETRHLSKDILAGIDKFDVNEKIKKNIDAFVNDFRTGNRNVKKAVGGVFKDFKDHESEIYWGVFGLILLVALPTFLLLLGLMAFGVFGYSSRYYPSERSCASNFGGYLLMSSVYMMFIFSSIVMLCTVVLFQAGGHVQAYGCEILYERNLSSLQKVLEIIPSSSQGMEELQDLNLGDVIRKCEENQAIYEALPILQKDFNISSLLSEAENLDKYLTVVNVTVERATNEVFEQLKKNMDLLKNINIEPSQFGLLFDLSEERIIKHLKVNETSVNLAKSLKDDHWDKEQHDILKDIVETLNSLSKAAIRRDAIAGIKNKLGDFENKLTKHVSDISQEIARIKPVALIEIKKIATNYVKKMTGNKTVTQLAEEIIDTVTTKVGKCKRLHNSFELARHFLCKQILGPVSALWFSFGTCCFFFLFAIPFATKLSKHFYRMETDANSYLQMDAMHSLQPIEFLNFKILYLADYNKPSVPNGKFYQPNPVFNDEPVELSRGQVGNNYEQLASPRNRVSNIYDQVSLQRGHVAYGDVLPDYVPKQALPRANHQVHHNHAYEPDIDARWTKY